MSQNTFHNADADSTEFSGKLNCPLQNIERPIIFSIINRTPSAGYRLSASTPG